MLYVVSTQEVFRSEKSDNTTFSKVLGKCYVMSVKEYFKYKPEGFAEKDIYVCESRYTSKLRQFKKIKVWLVPRNSHVRIVPRDEPLSPVRVASVFANTGERSMSPAPMLEVALDESDVLDKARQVRVQREGA